jgi:hypothetical protein
MIKGIKMSYVCNTGTVSLNKELTDEAIEAVKTQLKNPEWYKAYLKAFKVGESEISLDEYYDKEFDETLMRTVKALAPLGYVLNGCITYFGDYGDGATYITDNAVEEYADTERWRVDCSDQELIKVLESRGYVVSKP